MVSAADRRPGSSEAVTMPGTRVEITLDADVPVTISPDTDEMFVGLLMTHAGNFALNISSVRGKWNPLTGARMKAECVECGNGIPFDAEDQETCATCLGVAKLKALPYTGEERRVGEADRREEDVEVEVNRRGGIEDRRAPVAKKSTKKASTKKSAKKGK